MKEHKTITNLPKWFLNQLEKTPEPNEKMISEYDFMKEGISEAFDEASAKMRAAQGVFYEKAVDVILTKAGKVKSNSEIVVEEVRSSQIHGDESTLNEKKMENNKKYPVMKMEKISDDARIELTTHQVDLNFDVFINVVQHKDGLSLRPFCVSMYDGQENSLQATKHIETSNDLTKFSLPMSGLYIFFLNWETGKGEFRLKFE